MLTRHPGSRERESEGADRCMVDSGHVVEVLTPVASTFTGRQQNLTGPTAAVGRKTTPATRPATTVGE